MNISSLKQSRLYRTLKVYLLSSGVIFQLVIIFALVQFVSGFLASGPTFAQALTNNGKNISQNYPSIAPLGSFLLSVGEKSGEKDYYSIPFDPANWPSVGPKSLSYLEMVPEELHDTFLYVKNIKELELAIRNVKPRSVIVLRDGTYFLKSKKIRLSSETPTKDSPIYVVAENSGKVTFELDTSEGFYVDKPHWHFMGLNIKGVCTSHNSCHHAFHVVGNGSYFNLSHSQLVDFNSAIKVNVLKNTYPDFGVIRYNHIYNTTPRNTKSPVNMINIDQVNHWVVSQNIVRDFLKYGGNRISYGAYFKGGSIGGELSNNLIMCESGEFQARGSTVGLSLGGGGMSQKHRRDQSEYETKGATIRNNIVMHCTDVGLYVNKGMDSTVYNNTFYNTYGLDLRFPQSSGTVFNNVLSGKIRKRNDGTGTLSNNVVVERNYWNGKNQMQELYAEPKNGDFGILNQEALLRLTETTDIPKSQQASFKDFCGQPVTQILFAGAIQPSSFCFKSKQ
jgi:parallel beta-helix repeat protein